LELSNEYAISRVTFIEFMSFKDMPEDEVDTYTSILENDFEIIEINVEIASMASYLRRRFQLKLGDAIILATTLVYGLQLSTNDTRLKRKYEILQNQVQ